MKKILWKIAISISLLMALKGVAFTKEWRSIVPLKSNRNDAERILGDPIKSTEWFSYYKLSREIVVVHFQVTTCDSDKFGLGWNVAPGTVVRIGVIPRGKHQKEEYLLASNSEIRDTSSGLAYYTDDAEGLTVETYKNFVTLMDYHPAPGQEVLRCPRIEKCCFDIFPQFDAYQALSFEDEKARLDNFLIQMNQMFARGVIEIVGPSRNAREQQLKRATRAKAYLVEKREAEPERLLVVDGGYRESSETRLYLYAIGGLASRIYLSPEKDPANTSTNKRMERTRW